MMRREMRRKLVEALERDHVLLVGKHGTGKTHMVKTMCAEKHLPYEIYVYSARPTPPAAILKECLSQIEDAKLTGSTTQLVKRLKALLEEKNLNLYLFLDDFHTATANGVAYFRMLQECKKVRVIAVATTPYYRKLEGKPGFKRFLWELKEIDMPGLTEDERERLLLELVEEPKNKLQKKALKIIDKNHIYNPLAIIHILKNTGSGLNPEVAQIKVIQEDAINLFAIWPAMAAFLIAAKYLYRSFGLYKTANLAGFVGILAYFLLRRMWWRKQ